MTDTLKVLQNILAAAIKEQASDLLISVGHHPTIRITGQLVPLVKEKVVTPEDAKSFAFALLGDQKKERFLADKEIDFSYDYEGKARFRVNIFYQRDCVSLALRLVSQVIHTIEDLQLPAVLHEFTRKTQGLVLVAGASGQGKSTTLAAMLDEINHTRAVHIITIEDPIEYIYT